MIRTILSALFAPITDRLDAVAAMRAAKGAK